MTREEGIELGIVAMGFRPATGPRNLRGYWYAGGESGGSPLFQEVPQPDDILSIHLAFVGRVAEAMGPKWKLSVKERFPVAEWRVEFVGEKFARAGTAPDPSWAALLAAKAVAGSSR